MDKRMNRSEIGRKESRLLYYYNKGSKEQNLGTIQEPLQSRRADGDFKPIVKGRSWYYFVAASFQKPNLSIDSDICCYHNCLQGSLIIQEHLLTKEKASRKYGLLALERQSQTVASNYCIIFILMQRNSVFKFSGFTVHKRAESMIIDNEIILLNRKLSFLISLS